MKIKSIKIEVSFDRALSPAENATGANQVAERLKAVALELQGGQVTFDNNTVNSQHWTIEESTLSVTGKK